VHLSSSSGKGAIVDVGRTIDEAGASGTSSKLKTASVTVTMVRVAGAPLPKLVAKVGSV
jgi:hypothetical protein